GAGRGRRGGRGRRAAGARRAGDRGRPRRSGPRTVYARPAASNWTSATSCPLSRPPVVASAGNSASSTPSRASGPVSRNGRTDSTSTDPWVDSLAAGRSGSAGGAGGSKPRGGPGGAGGGAGAGRGLRGAGRAGRWRVRLGRRAGGIQALRRPGRRGRRTGRVQALRGPVRYGQRAGRVQALRQPVRRGRRLAGVGCRCRLGGSGRWVGASLA